jgi:4-diphosphocytidyl-2-C-methyl-D-erythritol kinase
VRFQKKRVLLQACQQADSAGNDQAKVIQLSDETRGDVDETAKKATADTFAGFDLVLHSPSKINVFLRVLQRRPDGFHEVATVMQAISLMDRIGFQELPDSAVDDVLECDNSRVPLDKSNLIIKALETFRLHTGQKKYYRVRLEKQIPTEAGLGGGSGNAATALFAANRLCGQPASNEDLIRWAGEVGSDTAFFFSRGSAYCTGRGEQLHPIQPLSPAHLYVIKPKGVGLSTATVYRALDVNSLNQQDAVDPGMLLEEIEKHGPFLAPLVNDLEEPAFALMPLLRELKAFIESFGFRRVLMSGSGTSFFALGFPDSRYGNRFKDTFVVHSRLQFGPLMKLFRDGVDVFECRFISRYADDRWYMERPPLESSQSVPKKTGPPFSLSKKAPPGKQPQT